MGPLPRFLSRPRFGVAVGILAALGFTAPAYSQIRINEVLPNPVGTDGAELEGGGLQHELGVAV